MSRLLRPTIPLAVKLAVALRQLAQKIGCNVGELQLDHDPALQNRTFDERTQKYTPPANNPDYLIYREKHAHKIKTLVRGDHGQLSDAGIRRKSKKAAAKPMKVKRKWPKRSFERRR